MKLSATKTTIIATGLAMFSMFFGAGNIVFPLAVGKYAQDQNFYAIIGLLITAVGVPFLGLIAMTLYNGNYVHFFERIGKVPGFLVALIIMGLIGPFGATPRLLTVSYSTIEIYFPNLDLYWFSICSCILIFLLTFRKNRILDILGYVLTPLLLLSLAIIIVKGIWFASTLPASTNQPLDIFMMGLHEGYQTMDLPGAFFFSSIVLACLEGVDTSHETPGGKNYRKIISMTLNAGAIGMSLLALTYIGFSYVAAYHSPALEGISKDRILANLALEILGPSASMVAIAAVALACLTTAIALVAVFTEFLHFDIFRKKIGYIPSLIATLVLTFFISTWGFEGIAKILTPALLISYPALIVLSIMNLLHKLYHVNIVKTPVYLTLAISLIAYLIG